MRQWRKPTPFGIAATIFGLLVALRFLNITPGAPTDAPSPAEPATVRFVLDGDTVELSDGRRVRLLGIDAPEMAHQDQSEQPFARESTQWLDQLLQNRKVTLIKGRPAVDRYGRTLAWIFTESGENVSELALRSGMARLLDAFGLPPEYESGLRQAAAYAQVTRSGLWTRTRRSRP